jgi:hypothetical protein
LTKVEIDEIRAEIVIEILVMQKSSASFYAGRNLRWRRSAALSCHNFKRWGVTTTNTFKKGLNKM